MIPAAGRFCNTYLMGQNKKEPLAGTFRESPPDSGSVLGLFCAGSSRHVQAIAHRLGRDRQMPVHHDPSANVRTRSTAASFQIRAADTPRLLGVLQLPDQHLHGMRRQRNGNSGIFDARNGFRRPNLLVVFAVHVRNTNELRVAGQRNQLA